jgi:hypothetical protein
MKRSVWIIMIRGAEWKPRAVYFSLADARRRFSYLTARARGYEYKIVRAPYYEASNLA